MKVEIEELELMALKVKADNWDKLGEKIETCYAEEGDEDFGEFGDEPDLATIGELAATAYGWL